MTRFCNVVQKIAGNTETPILLCHGESDPVVPHRWGQESAALLKKYNKSIDFRSYKNMAHSSCDKVWQIIQFYFSNDN